MKSKNEPANARTKRLLEVLSSYLFNLYYMMGKDMTLSDFLLRIKVENLTSMKSFQLYFIVRSSTRKNIIFISDPEHKTKNYCRKST